MGDSGGLRLESIFTHKVMDPLSRELLHSIGQDFLRQVDPVDITVAGFASRIRVSQHHPVEQTFRRPTWRPGWTD